jgi:hypothetical protein
MGESASHWEMVKLGMGMLAVTNKRLVFSSTDTTFAIPLGKIVGVTPYSDGIGVTRDSTAQSNRPYLFTCPAGAGQMYDVVIGLLQTPK